VTKKEKRQPMQSTGRKRPPSTGEEKRQPMQSTRCVETIDIEEMLDWMVRNPDSYPDNNLLEEGEEADV
jgi:hypothetical protein